MNTTVLFYGTNETFKLLGKQGQKTDIEYRHYVKDNNVLTFVRPIRFPEKIRPLIQSLYVSDYVIIELETIDKAIGELIVALDLIKRPGAIITSFKNQGILYEFENLVKGTALEKYDKIVIKENNEISLLRERLFEQKPKILDKFKVVIDQAFNIKNIGLVALGFLLGGKLVVKEKYKLFPGNKDVQVNSIQTMDKNFKEVNAKERVGIALKNCKLEDIVRGSVLLKDGEEVSEVSAEIIKSKFYNGPNNNIIAVNGMLFVPCKIEGNKLIFDKKIVPEKEIVLINPNAKQRIYGIAKV